MKIKCKICNDDGKCRNNKNSPNYDEFYSDIYDCCDYVDKNWIVNWVKRLQKKDKEQYLSNYVKWVENTH